MCNPSTWRFLLNELTDLLQAEPEIREVAAREVEEDATCRGLGPYRV